MCVGFLKYDCMINACSMLSTTVLKCNQDSNEMYFPCHFNNKVATTLGFYQMLFWMDKYP